MISFDHVAGRYDATRGGESRGDEYAAELHRRLPDPAGPVLELGVGTGVVSLGLRRRGHGVIGVDISAPMLERAHDRLESGLVRGDACRLPFRDGSLQQAVAVWVAHALREPAFMFAEVARVLVGGGTYLVCPAGRPGPGDRIGAVIDEMALGVDAHIGRAARAGWEATPERILQWGVGAGFVGHAEDMEIRTWTSSPEAEIGMIHRRIWPALVDLDEVTFDRLTGPTIAVLAAMPPGVTTRSSLAEVVVLRRAG